MLIGINIEILDMQKYYNFLTHSKLYDTVWRAKMLVI